MYEIYMEQFFIDFGYISKYSPQCSGLISVHATANKIVHVLLVILLHQAVHGERGGCEGDKRKHTSSRNHRKHPRLF